MDEKAQVIQKAANKAIKNESELTSLIETLSGASRRERQSAAQVLAFVAHTDASVLAPYTRDFVDALNRPEAQTRWECLDVLACLVEIDPKPCDKALAGAEAALFDEESGPVRLAAMRFLCRLGAVSRARSEKTWPLIDEAIQCYHGDLEFTDMLIAVAEFAKGTLSSKVKLQLAERMRFDAENGKGALKRRAAAIVASVS